MSRGADCTSVSCLHVVISQENETVLWSAATNLSALCPSLPLLEGPPLHYPLGEKWLTFIFL